MTWQEMVTIIFGSGILSAIITLVGEYFFKNTDYKQDYYKKIIDKRLEAYEDLDKFIGWLDVMRNVELKTIVNLNDESGIRISEIQTKARFCIYRCFSSIKTLSEAGMECLTVCGRSFWYSPKVRKNLEKLNEKLSDCNTLVTFKEVKYLEKLNLTELEPSIDGENFVSVLGNAVFPEIKELLRTIVSDMSADLEKLHNVEQFLEEKNDN